MLDAGSVTGFTGTALGGGAVAVLIVKEFLGFLKNQKEAKNGGESGTKAALWELKIDKIVSDRQQPLLEEIRKSNETLVRIDAGIQRLADRMK